MKRIIIFIIIILLSSAISVLAGIWTQTTYEDFNNGIHNNTLALDLENSALGLAHIPEKIGMDSHINDYYNGLAYNPTIASNTIGYMMIWNARESTDDNYYDIYYQLYNTENIPLGSNVMVNDSTGEGLQHYNAAITYYEGYYLITWYRRNGDNEYGIYAQLYQADGIAIGTNFRISDILPSGVQQTAPRVASGGGQFIITWYDNREGEMEFNVYFQRLDLSGNLIGDNTLAHNNTIGWQYYSDIAVDNLGNFFIVWMDDRDNNETHNYEIYGCPFNSDGIALCEEFQINDTDEIYKLYHPAIAYHPSGNCLIVWEDDRSGNAEIYAQWYDTNGEIIDNNFLISDYEEQTGHGQPALTFDNEGNLIINWYAAYWEIIPSKEKRRELEDYYLHRIEGDILLDGDYINKDEYIPYYSILAQCFDTNGFPQGNNFRLDDYAEAGEKRVAPAITYCNDNFISVWYDGRNDTMMVTTTEIYASYWQKANDNTPYADYGYYTSIVCNTLLETISYDTLILDYDGSIGVQLRSANTLEELEEASWFGAEGENSFYTEMINPISVEHNLQSYIQYRVYLYNEGTKETKELPILYSLNITWHNLIPSIPSNFIAEAGDREIYLSWDENPIEENVIYYNLYRSHFAGFTPSENNLWISRSVNYFNDTELDNNTTYYYRLNAINDLDFESEYTLEIHSTPINLPPEPISNLTASLPSCGRVYLEWIPSPSYDASWYNIYSDNATGIMDYENPIITLAHPQTEWTSEELIINSTYQFGIRTEDLEGNEEENENIISITPICDSAIVRTNIVLPHNGDQIYGNMITIMAWVIVGHHWDISNVLFQYRSVGTGDWIDMISAHNNFPNPDSTFVYLIFWDVTSLENGEYQLRSIATDDYGNPDPAPPYITITINPHNAKIIELDDDGEGNHIKNQALEVNINNIIEASDIYNNGLTSILLPNNAIPYETRLILTMLNPENHKYINNKGLISANEYRRITFEDGITNLLPNKYLEITIPYNDENNDGIVDNTLIDEQNLGMYNWNESLQDWLIIDNIESNIEENWIKGFISEVGLLGLFDITSTGIDEPIVDLLTEDFALLTNYPNPFNPQTTITYTLPEGLHYTNLQIYNIKGELVCILVSEEQKDGIYTIIWDGTDEDNKPLPSGLYIYRLSTEKFVEVRKMLLLK